MDKIELPKQLQEGCYRFCLLSKGTKISYRDHTKYNYSFEDKEFLACLEIGFNYGVLCGYGNLLIVDVDDDYYLENIKKLALPETFTISTALKKKPHYYFTTEELKTTRRFNGLDLLGIRR